MAVKKCLRAMSWAAALVLLLLIAPSGALSAGRAHAGSMPVVAVPAAAQVPLATPLSRTGWTASASDEETSAEPGGAANVLDGSPTTIWRSSYSSGAVALPHFITIDMKSAVAVSGLRYLPRVGPNRKGTIGQYTVTVSADGSSWGSPVTTGTWADDDTEKTASFAAVLARYVRLTALTEAGDRGPATSVAELNLLGVPSSSPQQVVLDRTGWKVRASDQETAGKNTSASNVLDGNSATFWQSKWSAELPHRLTLTLPAATTVTGLRYLPRQDASAPGRIGAFSISTSTDGTTWSAPVARGTWSDTLAEKSVSFTGVSTRFIRLTATSEAGGRGLGTSAAEINLLGNAVAPPAPGGGSWGPVIGFPIVPVSAVLLPNDKLLTFSAYSPTAASTGGQARTQIAILDLAASTVSGREVANTGHEMFCSGLALLPDGRLLISGGSDAGLTTIYNPADDTWTAGPALNIPRGYESDVTLSTGQVLTLGGSWNGGIGGKDGEIYTAGGTWQRLTGVTADKILTDDAQGVFRADNHAWLFALSGGGVFQAGPSTQMNWITTSGAGSMTAAGSRADDGHAMNGNAVMYDVGRILTDGGAPDYQNSTATTNAYTLDIRQGPGHPVAVTKVASMVAPRAFQNSVVLPDGEVLVIGGQADPVPFTDDGSAMSPELWNPATGQFSLMAAMAVPRNYHSVAVLLPDGRVFSGGGGLCGSCATNHADGQIFTPPYLLTAQGALRTRPAITTAPTTARPGAVLSVTTDVAVSSFALVRMGAVTHTVDTDQRRIPLVAGTPSGTTYSLTIPSDTGTVVPGNYLLFALDGAGTPSVAKVVSVR